jgi:twitching motility protein PilT
MVTIQQWLIKAVEKQASDVHLCAGLVPMIRVAGDLVPLSEQILEKDFLNAQLQGLMSSQQYQQFIQNFDYDFSFSIAGLARFRANFFHQSRGPGAVFRIIPEKLLSLEDLNLPDVFKKICNFKHGLILITGSTGSGKTTTMAAMIDYINSHQCKHIITIEDPIELMFISKKSVINQREVRTHTLGFHHALHATLREDPDIILVGEMRDIESIRLAITAAETGHLVLSTLHTNSAQETIDRIVHVFPANEQGFMRSMLSLSLQAVISQSLLKKKEGGRVAVYEIMLANTAIRNLIRENKTHQIYSILQTAQAEGMITREQCIKQLMARGITLQ